MQLKQKVYDYFNAVLQSKIAAIQHDLDELREIGANETKSAAGDKYETSRAMVQIEQANKQKQLDELLAQKAVMQKIDPSVNAIQVVQGSLVRTQQAYFFISAALGRMDLEGQTVFAISAQSPIGQKIMGLKKGEQLSFNQIHYRIEEIF